MPKTEHMAIPLPKINELLAEGGLGPVGKNKGHIKAGGVTPYRDGFASETGEVPLQHQEQQFIWLQVEYPE